MSSSFSFTLNRILQWKERIGTFLFSWKYSFNQYERKIFQIKLSCLKSFVFSCTISRHYKSFYFNLFEKMPEYKLKFLDCSQHSIERLATNFLFTVLNKTMIWCPKNYSDNFVLSLIWQISFNCAVQRLNIKLKSFFWLKWYDK